MSKFILDASALLAYIKGETGGQNLENVLNYSIISAVNYSEVIAVLQNLGIPFNSAQSLVHDLIQNIVPFTQPQAAMAANLRTITKPLGLSLGDRACLALGIEKQLPIYTADKAWSKISIKNLEIEMIR